MNIRNLAKNNRCMVRIPSVCNGDESTTILAHLRLAGITGIGQKANDMLGAWCCSSCHDVVDNRVKSIYSRDEIAIMFYEGIFRTQAEILKNEKN